MENVTELFLVWDSFFTEIPVFCSSWYQFEIATESGDFKNIPANQADTTNWPQNQLRHQNVIKSSCEGGIFHVCTHSTESGENALALILRTP